MKDTKIYNYMPCGFVVTGSLKDLGHYNKCMDAACKSRAQSWEEAKREASDPIKKILDKRKC